MIDFRRRTGALLLAVVIGHVVVISVQVNTRFGVILLGGLFFFKTSLLRYVFDSAFRIDEEGWNKLTFRWGLYFIAMAVVNEIIWRNFSTNFWVAFKVWGFTPLAIVFTMSQMPLIHRHSLEEAPEK